MIHHRHHTVHINILMAHECKSGVYYYGYYLICDLLGPVKVRDHGFFIINKYRTLPIVMCSIYDLEVVLGAWGIFSKGRRSTDTGEIWTCLHLEFRLPFGTSHPFRALVIKASCPPSLGTSTATKLLKGKIKKREKSAQ